MLETGQQAPDFSLDTDTSPFSLAEHHGKNVVVFFFPKANTSGCTKEAIAFSSLHAEFEAANTIVIGISKDDAKKQAKFRDKHGLTCLLGADVDGTVCEAFSVWVEKSMYGRKYMGIQRATFLIGPDGALSHIWPKVKVPGHAEDVLECLQAGG
ncbi:peroxiredoxin [Alphaproteobacteria bacterium]|nr:peroxiredoxin [Alphaproteobacteria bacterium]